MTSLSDYWTQLEAHDWLHAMSDDNSVYKRGQKEHTRLNIMAGESHEHRKLFDEMKSYVWGQGEKPKKPVEEPKKDDTTPTTTEPMEKTFRIGEK